MNIAAGTRSPLAGTAFENTYKLGVAPEEAGRCGAPWPAGVTLLPLRLEGEAIVAEGRRGAATLTAEPVGLLGLVTFGDAGLERMEAVAARLSAAFAVPPPAIGRFRGEARAETLAWLAERLVALLDEGAARTAGLSRALAAVRAEHEETQEAFRRLEALADASFRLDRTLSLALEPKGPSLELGAVRQRVACSSEGVSDIGLHLAVAPADPGGALAVVLSTVEDGGVAARWSVPGSALRPGWLRLSLPRSLGPDRRTLSISAAWRGDGPLALSLSVPHPDPRWCATVEGGGCDRVLALRAWRSMPGTAPAPASTTAEAGAARGRWLVPQETMAAVEPVTGDPGAVRFLAESGACLVHPSGSSPTVARLPVACPRGAAHVSAEVRTDHPEAGTVEYALLVGEPRAGLSGGPRFSEGSASEWLALPAATTSEIHLFLPRPLDAPADLYLATRLPAGQSGEYCWARFSRIMVQGPATAADGVEP